jgi:guanylate kinase
MALIIIAGKSGSGKDAVVNELCRRGYKRIKTYTTRPMRQHESQGNPYYFISEKEFKEKESKGFFLETKEYNTVKGTWYYGSPKKELLSQKNNTENRLIILTPSGVEDFTKETRDKKINAKIIYLRANSGTISKRLRRRGDNIKEVERRMAKDEKDFVAFEYFADKCIYNNSGSDICDIADIIDEYIRSM